jgi:hypothetical protein
MHPSLAPCSQGGTCAKAPSAAGFPSAELQRQCSKEASALRGRLGGSFAIVEHAPFIVAGDMPADKVDDYIKRDIVGPADMMWQTYFDARPNAPITVLLLSTDKAYHEWARKLFGDTDLPYYGYYKSAARTLVMNMSTGEAVVTHELTHALMDPDFPQVPLWFAEAVASLHEQFTVRDGQMIAEANFRLPPLQDALRQGKLRPLKDMITKNDFYGMSRGLNYAHARYFAMYLQKQGWLADYYKYFRDNYNGPGSDVKALEHVTGKRIDQVDAEFVAWVKTLN